MSEDHSSIVLHGMHGPRVKKRKQQSESKHVRGAKQQTLGTKTRISNPNALVIVLGEYELLERVVSNLCANDLLALALTSRALLDTIIPRSISLENLLGRVKCSGEGVRIRKQSHQKSPFFYSFDCTEYVLCGSEIAQRKVEKRSCSTCKVATCNECRLHCVYQSIFEASSDSDDPAELPNFSGFVLLQPSEQAILSPHHLASDYADVLPRWQDPSKGRSGPYHDQGFLDTPLEMDATASPECIEVILDLDLGHRSLLSLSEDSHYMSPSPVLQSLCRVVEARKINLCNLCFERCIPNGPAALLPSKLSVQLPWLSAATHGVRLKECACTLKSRMLDRWLCLRCYQAEESAIERYIHAMPPKTSGLCCCGSNVQRVICLWCWGEVKLEAEKLYESDGTTP
jgi:hypothetical protein